MQRSMKILSLSLILLASVKSIAAQESYTLPGGVLVHKFNCSVPESNGEAVLGVGYSLQCATSVRGPILNVVDCALITTAIVANPQPTITDLDQAGQDQSKAVFENDFVRVVLRKSDFTARMKFSNGAISNCVRAN